MSGAGQALGVDVEAYRSLFAALRESLECSAVPRLFTGAALGGNPRAITASINAIAGAASAIDVEQVRALTAVPRVVGRVPDGYEGDLHRLVVELTSLYEVRVIMALGPRRVDLLRDLLAEAQWNLLRVFRKEDDENAHSDVLAWLLDPLTACNIAPAVLLGLGAKLSSPTDTQGPSWRQVISSAIESGRLSVRREVVVDAGRGDDGRRIDLVLSGPDFVLAIENKSWSSEHSDQTLAYERWLTSLKRVPRKAGIFLSPSGMKASSSAFTALGYLELARYLLDAPLHGQLNVTERQVLGGYLRALHARVLKIEFDAISR